MLHSMIIMSVTQISALDLKTKLDHQEKLFLLDVREPQEFDYAHITGSVSIPLNQLPTRVSELSPDDNIVVICHHGIRSLQAANYLLHADFKKISNLQGGIDAWSRHCDNSVKRY